MYFWSVLQSTLPLSAALTQARHSESESNYRDNYDRDPVRPGFVIKWTHLPSGFGAPSSKGPCVNPEALLSLSVSKTARPLCYTLRTITIVLRAHLLAECIAVLLLFIKIVGAQTIH